MPEKEDSAASTPREKNRTSPENQETDWQELVISKQCAERAGRLHHNHAAVSAAAVVGVSLETHATT